MPIQAFIDESEGQGGNAAFVLAGLIGPSELWTPFSDLWSDCLHREPRIRKFKMREAAGLRGEFRGWTENDRDFKVDHLASCLAPFGFAAIAYVAELDAFRRTIKQHARKPHDQPYFFAFHSMIMAVGYELLERGFDDQRFEIIFDENAIFGGKAKTWYPLVRFFMDEDLKAIVPTEPLFRTDDEFMPLQAADLMAWLFRMDNSRRPHQFQWLQAKLKKVLFISEHSQYVDRKRMLRQIERSRQMQITDELITLGKRLLGDG